jgi:hypothetical protein
MTIGTALFSIVIGSVLTLAATAEVAKIDLPVVRCILHFRPAPRQREEVDASTSHIGFRCVVRVGR